MADAHDHDHDDEHGDGDHSHPHILSWQLLTGIFVALLLLTVITVAAARIDLGEANIIIAMLIAGVKASLVALFFMHLKYGKPFNAVVLVTSLGMLALFLAMASMDTGQYQHTLDPAFGEQKMATARKKAREKLIKDGEDPYLYPSERRAAEKAKESGEDPETAKTGDGAKVTMDPKKVAKLQKKANKLFGPLERAPGDPLGEPIVQLGQKLFFDARLSRAHDVSCASCHDLNNFGIDPQNRALSPGHKGKLGTRNSPTVLNAFLAEGDVGQFWDGRSPSVEDQALEPITNPHEMANTPERVVATLKSMPGYVELFTEAFGGADPVTFANVGKAIGAFERKLVTPGRLDKFMGGDKAALSDAELRGLDAFIQSNCIMCHFNSPAVGGAQMQKLGLQNDYPTQDQGRFEHSKKTKDKGMWKSAQLRNVARTGPWFHDGSITDLGEAVKLMAYHQLDKELNDKQVDDIVAFLTALDGEQDDYLEKLAAKPDLPPSVPGKTPPPEKD